MSTDTKSKHKQADVLQRFADPWALLNADADDLRSAASDYPQEEVEDLVELVAGLRTLYRSRVPRHRPSYPIALRVERLRQLAEHVSYMTGLLLAVENMAMDYGLMQLEGQVEEQTEPSQRPRPAALGFHLFDALRKPLLWLLETLEQEDPPLLYKCEYCGRIGEAQRSDKRWCSDRCRMRVARGG